MEKITYVIGAGFSATANIPVMSNFIVKAKDLYYSMSGQYKEFKSIFDKIDDLAKIKTYCNSDLLNIEELLSIYDMEDVLSKKRNSTSFSSFIISTIKHYSFTEDDIQHQYPGNWYDFIFGNNEIHKNIGAFVASIFKLEFYDHPASTRENSFSVRPIETDTKYSIISLNYDTLLECALKGINNGYRNQLSFEKEEYNGWSSPMLFKLHGDIDTNKIIPPTWAKTISSEMLQVWRNAYELIRSSTQIRFLGYSLPISDSYFLYFLKSAIKNNPYLKNIDVICLDSNHEVEDRYKKVFCFRDFRYKNRDIRTYLTDLWKPKGLGGFTNPITRYTEMENTHNEYMSQE